MKLYTHAPAVVLYMLHFKYNYSKEFSQLKSIKDFSFSSHLINSLSKGIKNPHTYIVSPKIHAWRNSLQGLVLKWIQIPEYIFCVKDVASGIDHAWPKSPIFLFLKYFVVPHIDKPLQSGYQGMYVSCTRGGQLVKFIMKYKERNTGDSLVG